jgi:hypothetical protein
VGYATINKLEPESLADQPSIDEEINHSIAASDSSKNQWQMPTPFNLDSSRLCQSTTMTNQNARLRLASPQITHLHLASPQSFASACIPFSTFHSVGIGLSSMVQSLAVKVQVSSTPNVSRHAFASLAFEPVTSTKQISLPNTALNATAEMELSADLSQDPGTLAEQPIAAPNSSQNNLPVDLGLRTTSQNPNKTSQLIIKHFITVR